DRAVAPCQLLQHADRVGETGDATAAVLLRQVVGREPELRCAAQLGLRERLALVVGERDRSQLPLGELMGTRDVLLDHVGAPEGGAMCLPARSGQGCGACASAGSFTRSCTSGRAG